MIRRTLLVVLLAVFLLVCGGVWYLFRPEKAFIDNPVNEPHPPGVPADTAPRRTRPIPRSNGKSLGWSMVVSLSHVSIDGGLPC